MGFCLTIWNCFLNPRLLPTHICGILHLQVDLVRRHCFPVYWHGENRRVLRGHWFARKGGLDWLPLREDVAEQLEFAYRSQVSNLFWIHNFVVCNKNDYQF